jgi:DNA ligase (NAD+)
MRVPRHAITEEELREYDREVRAALGQGSVPEYTVEPRVSGIEVVLFYENGVLCRAVTRSDSYGESDVTPNIRTILTVPLEIFPISGVKGPPDQLKVWGIAYLEGEGWGKGVAASIIGADLKETARRPYNLFCCGVGRAVEVGSHFLIETHYEIMLALQSLGFRVNRPHIRHCAEISAVIENICTVKEERGSLPWDVDGAIVQVDPLAQRRALQEKGSLVGPIITFGLEPAPAGTGAGAVE